MRMIVQKLFKLDGYHQILNHFKHDHRIKQQIIRK